MVGHWIQREPFSFGASAIVGFAIALSITIFVYKRTS
jgi:hypothetical protein